MLDFSVYIRPLQIEDAEISYKWRNNPKIWRLTGSRPNITVTPEIEKEWLKNVLNRKTEKRFAICLKGSDAYIGNVFFTDIENGAALLQIFIGEIENWGRRRALEAMILLIAYGFEQLHLDKIFGIIDENNKMSSALAITIQSTAVDHYIDKQTKKKMVRWLFSKEMFEQGLHLKPLQTKLTTEKRI
jgi:diamine N-acetyltransferase